MARDARRAVEWRRIGDRVCSLARFSPASHCAHIHYVLGEALVNGITGVVICALDAKMRHINGQRRVNARCPSLTT